MTVFEIDRKLKSMQREAKNGLTLLMARQGNVGNPKPFVAFLDDGNIETIGKEPIIYRASNIHTMIHFIEEYLEQNPETGYWFA